MALKKIAIQVRLPEDLHEILKAISKAEGRSLNNMIVYLLSVGVEGYENSHK